MIPAPAVIEGPDFDAQLQDLPNSDGVFVVWAGDASTYLAKTSMLRRRLLRILRPGEPSRGSLNLRSVATRVEYWLTGSRFESGLVHYSLARQHYRDGPSSVWRICKILDRTFARAVPSGRWLVRAFPKKGEARVGVPKDDHVAGDATKARASA
jgi:hypothetical protein